MHLEPGIDNSSSRSDRAVATQLSPEQHLLKRKKNKHPT